MTEISQVIYLFIFFLRKRKKKWVPIYWEERISDSCQAYLVTEKNSIAINFSPNFAGVKKIGGFPL